MKKNVGKFFGGLLTFALLTGFYSCSNGSSSDDDIADLPQNITQDIYSGDLITFTATKDSKSSNDVNIILKYDRSEKGAKEQLVLSNVELEVNVNNSKINMPDKITFNLEPYSSLDSNYTEGTEETRSEYQKEYKVKLPLNKKISAGDKITLQLKSTQLGGEGLGKVSPEAIVTALIDNSEAANWYTELCEDEYKSSLITKKNGKGLNEKESPENTEKPAEGPANQEEAQEVSETILFNEEKDLTDWAVNIYLTGDKFTGSKKSIIITYKKGSTFKENDNVIQLMKPWDEKYKVGSSVTGSVSFDSENPDVEDLWPWDTESEESFTFNPTDEDWEKLTSDGLAIQGHGAIITKVAIK